MTLALIDADIFQYAHGSATDDEFRPLAWPLVQSRVQAHINKIMEETGADTYQLFLTSDDKSNFRYNVATIKPYKGQRPSEKPFWYTHIRNFLVDSRGAIEIFGREADDALAEVQWNDWNERTHRECRDCTIICSLDKDLDMVPGWHYKWSHSGTPSKGPYYISPLEGMANFYCQCLTGDPVDNIPGLYGVGKSSKLLSRVRECVTDYDMYCIVRDEYEKRFGSYADKFLKENADLLWMRRSEHDEWNPPENHGGECYRADAAAGAI